MKSYSEPLIREHYRTLTELLIRKKLSITTMESATAGQIASLITDTEGSSAILKGAFVTYSNEAKIKQGVPAEVIEKFTVYSRETAAAMANACRKAYDADIGIGVTGTMGNIDPANPEASVPGQVYFAISVRGEDGEEGAVPGDTEAYHAEPGGVTEVYHAELAPQPTRLMYKLAVAEEVYERLIGKVSGWK